MELQLFFVWGQKDFVHLVNQVKTGSYELSLLTVANDAINICYFSDMQYIY